mmetsp:Transcript_23394/g.67410  ORF Transcript_23394/g.67410 Transcript_23394/m.67410 type:complete len:303 (-) Transcript_23394:66-974(-)|eukprot:CAMPEP_0181042452 /NCGR_PEP_ID=MMETSP1070-20121207/12158_1 /TAXON_ID=265543 /ORGANISM="Minutocellus polymorphus, Strain NH13" /LENGTH=302 /DNA_ID=CAMNT_0023120667 /DNA_START=44 /DNA_END=952 /DNA_ORIENTATION=+
MSATTRRRGKQQRATTAGASAAADDDAAGGTNAIRAPPQPPASTAGGVDADTKVQQAIARVAMANTRTRDLHEMWRSTLHKMAYLVALLALHQLNGTVGQCIRDVKSVNSAASDGGGGSPLSGVDTIGLILTDALPAILGIVISGLLLKFLSLYNERTDLPADFSSPWYYVGAGMVPMIISLHFQTLNSGGGGGSDDGSVTGAVVASCVSAHETASQFFDPGTEAEIAARVQKQIPVAIVYHTVVTVSYWFMKKGREQCERNMELLRSLNGQMQELKQTNKDLKAKKKAASGGGGGSTKKKK